MAVVDSQGIRIFYEEYGAGTPVVLGHSFLCSGSMWHNQVPDLARQCRVVNVDLRGHGRSGPVEGPFSLTDAVEDVIAVLDDCRIDRAVWCGLSIGGMVALRAGLTRPERVAGLILLDTDAGAETWARRVKYRAMGALARIAGVRPLSGEISRLMFGRTTQRRNPGLVRAWQNELVSMHVPSMLRVLQALIRRDSVVDRLSAIAVPAAVIVGREDASLPPRLARRIHEGLPGSTFVEVPEAGHLCALERPEFVTRTILDFLQTHDLLSRNEKG